MRQIEGGVTAAKGFMAAATAAGIKYQGRTDMAMVYSTAPCRVGAVFTSNVVKAAPVQWDRRITREQEGTVRCVVVNSGIANAGTGREGMRVCEESANHAAAALGIGADEVLLSSTGVIGMQMPIEKVCAGIDAMVSDLGTSAEAGTKAARAIMTTDTVKKEYACEVMIGGKTVTIGGMSKGSGMIHPNMCTMLSYVTTDAAIDKKLLQEAVEAVTGDTFNMISVDGDTSTNDTFCVLANGLAGNETISEKNADYDAFVEGLSFVAGSLARLMAKDGEGATTLIIARVEGMDTKENAKVLARSVVASSLTKAAVYGKDANWGRVLCALGYAGVDFDPEKVSLYYESGERSLLVYDGGLDTGYSEEEAAAILGEEEVTFRALFQMGDASAEAYGCDLTHEYVNINADYRS